MKEILVQTNHSKNVQRQRKKILKQEKNNSSKEATLNQLIISHTKRRPEGILKVLKEKTKQKKQTNKTYITLYSENLCFNNDGKVKTFPNKE